MDLSQRIHAYLDSIPSAVEGQSGHSQLLNVCRCLLQGFNLSEAQARPFVLEYCNRCVPPFTNEKEIEHKIHEAASKPFDKPKGYLLGNRKGHKHTFGAETAQSMPGGIKVAHKASQTARNGPKYKSDKSQKLPEPIEDGCRKLLLELFRPGEGIGMSLVDEESKPRDAHLSLSREDWLQKLDKHDGNPNKIFGSKHGVFIRVNPMKIGGGSDGDVSDFRYCLLEWDEMELSEQYSIILQSNIPVAALLFSGSKSIHAWCRVDAADANEYKERVKLLYEHFKDYKLDPKNKNPSRFSRLPGMQRGVKRQELLALNIGAASFVDWQEAQVDIGLPRIVSFEEFCQMEIPKPPELIEGILHIGEKLVLGGSSKAYKTWALADLAMSVAAGADFWGFKTNIGRVLYVNFEIQDWFFRWRLTKIMQHRGIDDFDRRNLDVWNLRGYCASFEVLIPKILKGIASKTYQFIVFDPFYKGLGGRDENSAGDLSVLMNEIERLAVEKNAAVGFGAHFSKGNQSDKLSLDRISGSGVTTRDPDTIVTMTELEEENYYQFHATFRNFPPMTPLAFQWEFPCFNRSPNTNPLKLKKNSPNQKVNDADVIHALRNGCLEAAQKDGYKKEQYAVANTQFVELIVAQFDVSETTGKRKIKQLFAAGKVLKDAAGFYYPKEKLTPQNEPF